MFSLTGCCFGGEQITSAAHRLDERFWFVAVRRKLFPQAAYQSINASVVSNPVGAVNRVE